MPISIYVLAKITAHWVTANLPIIILAPILATTLQMPANLYLPMVTALLLGTPAMSLIGSVGAALTIGTRRNGVLMPLLVLPLYIPTLIFGVGAVDAASMGFQNTNIYAALAGVSLIAAGLVPWATATTLQIFNE
jgi:heme exporter protein B